jgi:hypothetical protein
MNRGVLMPRLSLAILAVVLIPCLARSQDNAVRVTGTVILPKGAKMPQGAIVSVKIYFYQEGVGRVTYYSQIGNHTFRVEDVSKPPEFSVAVHKSYPEKHGAGEFLMKASVYASDGKKAKLVYTSSDDDAVVPFTGAGKPKTNVKLRVSKDD